MPVSLKDIREAFEFVGAGGGGEHQAFLCKQSGKLYCHSDLCDDLDILPDDIDDSEKFLQIPDKRELDLGKPLALEFARQFLPGDFDNVRQFFSGRGAYARFKNLLDRRGVLDQWYDFEAEAEERALRMWCDLNSIEVCDELRRPDPFHLLLGQPLLRPIIELRRARALMRSRRLSMLKRSTI